MRARAAAGLIRSDPISPLESGTQQSMVSPRFLSCFPLPCSAKGAAFSSSLATGHSEMIFWSHYSKILSIGLPGQVIVILFPSCRSISILSKRHKGLLSVLVVAFTRQQKP